MKSALNSSLDLIGNTPKIKLQKILPENAADVWLKYEAVNPTGSYKDRMTKSVLGNGKYSQGVVHVYLARKVDFVRGLPSPLKEHS